MSRPAHPALEAVQTLQRAIRDHVVEAFRRADGDALADVAQEAEGDTLYAVDRVGEDALIAALEPRAAALGGVVLIAEGLPGGRRALPRGTGETACRYRILVDPIDGTRGLMYQKRSAWVLTGVAPNRGDATRSTDIELAVQTEIPISKQRIGDELYAVRGRGAVAERVNLDTGERVEFALSPSRACTIAHGYASMVGFFPGGRRELAALDDALAEELLGPPVPGKAQSFADQYPSTGGQLYELMVGHDRFVADLRPLVERRLSALGRPFGACCHPYDLAASLIAEEAGVLITDTDGQTLDFPLDLATNVAWLGYANRELRSRIEPPLFRLLREHQLSSGRD
jgi:fructose-1,6-bisphosphatase/inositol monophosphatase family enzyme